MDIFEQLGNVYTTAQNVVRGTSTQTSSENVQVYQSKIPNNRDAVSKRNMIKWFLPETGMVEMYINPKNITYNDQKTTSMTRTKGGFIGQYWGEELTKISITGTTGSSGIEGINVLYDVYRNEQVAMDALAQAADAANEADMERGGILSNIIGEGSITDAVGNLVGYMSDSIQDQINNVLEYGTVNPVIQKPTLASMAFQVEMYHSGWAYRGFFTSFRLTESADSLGLFDYSMEFTATQKRGLRLNFLPWQRSATDGPSNSDPAFGTPYSFGALRSPVAPSRAGQLAQSILIRSVDDELKSYRPIK
jgi:hypothetical protein